MVIDRNERARLGAQLRMDSRLTHAEHRAAEAILFAGTDCRTGRCQMFRERIARESAVSLSSVDRAIAKLKELGYVEVIPTYGPRCREIGGRWFRPRGASVFVWVSLIVRVPTHPCKIQKEPAMAPMSPGLQAALARLGHGIADRMGRPAMA